MNNLSMQNFSLSALKNTLDEVRVQVYPRNETEKKVSCEDLNASYFV